MFSHRLLTIMPLVSWLNYPSIYVHADAQKLFNHRCHIFKIVLGALHELIKGAVIDAARVDWSFFKDLVHMMELCGCSQSDIMGDTLLMRWLSLHTLEWAPSNGLTDGRGSQINTCNCRPNIMFINILSLIFRYVTSSWISQWLCHLHSWSGKVWWLSLAVRVLS